MKKLSTAGEKIAGCNPATGEKLGEFDVNTTDDVKYAIRKAREVQPKWASLSAKERASRIMKIREFLVNNVDDLALTISRDNGKTRIDALVTEILPAILATKYYCKKAPSFLRDRYLFPGSFLLANKISKIRRVPYGVVGIISPWNYPFCIPFSEVIMALLAGNAVVLKVATETQLVGHKLKKAIDVADLPDGLFTYINMPGRLAGDAFLNAGVDKLFFTGSTTVGKELMKKAANTLTPICLELGGNDPMIVCEDANLERAAAGAVWAGLQNAGQSCGAVERIYVHESVYEKFLEILKEKVENLRIGVDTNFQIDIGAITTARQMKIVEEHIEDALSRGATIYAQSKPPKNLKGNFLPAIVLVNVNHSMKIMKEETFGPVLPVMPYRYTSEAIALANDSTLGLTASVWSRNRKKAKEIGQKIKAGVITINDHLMTHGMPETPWGGFKESGIGRTHGKIGFDEMTQVQVVVDDLLSSTKKGLWWHPYERRLYNRFKGAIDIVSGKSWLNKLKGLFSLARIFPRIFF